MNSDQANLIGIWKLTAFDAEVQQTGERAPFFGAAAYGYLILTPEGRMMALLTRKGREPGQSDQQQAVLFRTMLSYTGTYRVEDGKFITDVDLSWNEVWNGTEQVRYFTLDGDRLDIITEWAPSPIHADRRMGRAILSWVRA